ncbi:uncharacterized protein LOC101453998 isoform X3 [Ceratitis capitata]|uniref:uncharacterized protein LOC101453998 isoform X3 n=1 Tax=Ceratitis capitata TaxID=7213 RepID=UPI000A10B927|nr:uncharacterized protein LOC101453998 isoform X3 [Ceratitis capitata]
MDSAAESNNMLDHILQAANRHPNSRVSKLIHSVEEERSQKNIVLLLIELAEHAEYATDFNISLKYYLDLFEQLGIGREIVLNEAGLLLINSSKVYARRVDYVQELVERQILTLTNADKEVETNRNENLNKSLEEKPKRTRKRLVAPVDDPYEVELTPRKFRKLTEEKRFLTGKFLEKNKISTSKFYRIESEQFIHPSAWIHASVADLENEDEIDSKRNYKLFTYHVEHRYNTLVPDINFRLHFKVKDYIDEEEERLQAASEYSDNSSNVLSDWPPLSEEYVEKYLDLENRVLAIGEVLKNRKRLRLDYESEEAVLTEVVPNQKMLRESNEEPNQNCHKTSEEINDISELSTNDRSEITISNEKDTSNENFTDQSTYTNQSQNLNSTEKSHLESTNNSDSLVNASVMSSENNLSGNSISNNNVEENTLNGSAAEKDENDTGIGESLIDLSNTNNSSNDLLVKQSVPSASNNEESFDLRSIILADERKSENDENEINLNKIRVYLPHLDDEGVYFSDLDDQEHRMLSPRVLTTDVFPSIPNKENITIVVDDEIRSILNLVDDEPPPTYILPIQIQPPTPPLELNIFKFHEKIVRRRLLFKLGTEMDLFLQSRSMKKTNCSDVNGRQYRPMKLFNDSPDVCTDKHTTIDNNILSDSEDYEDFLGFTEEEQATDISHHFKRFQDSYDAYTDKHCAIIDSNIHSDSEDVEDFLGFTEEEQASIIPHRLSRDSGVDADALLTSNNIEAINEESVKEADFLHPITEVENIEENKEVESMCDQTVNAININEISKLNESSSAADISDNDMSVSHENDINAKFDTLMDSSEFTESHLKYIENEIDFDKSKTKIQKWHEYLQPILAKARDRHHFDVFKLGTEIINDIQKPITFGTSITFQDVMTKKEESYVSRYFLSTLLLANQNNIKIAVKNKCTDKPSAWSDINLDLLDTKRHTVAIEDNIGIINSKLPKESILAKPNSDQSLVTSDCRVNAKLTRNGIQTVHVDLNVVRPLKQIEKLPSINDDYDSGIFSTEECSL